MQQCMKIKNHNQVEFTPGINILYYIKVTKKIHMIISTDIEKNYQNPASIHGEIEQATMQSFL